jgi:hypothetical protein
MFPAGLNDMFGAEGVDFIKRLPGSPDPGECRHMKHCVLPGDRRLQILRLSQISPKDGYALSGQFGVISPGKDGNGVSPRLQLFDQNRRRR